MKTPLRQTRALSCPARLLMLAVLVCWCCGSMLAGATSTADIQDAKAFLQRLGIFNTFLALWQQADDLGQPPLSSSPVFQFFNVTIFAPIDTGFSRISADNYKYFRCSNPVTPNGCAFPIVTFHMAKQQLLLNDMKNASVGTKWETIEGSSVENFKGNKAYNRVGFFIGPEVGGIFGASKVSPSVILLPDIYLTANITIHAIDFPMAPPDTYPNGFNLTRPCNQGHGGDDPSDGEGDEN